MGFDGESLAVESGADTDVGGGAISAAAETCFRGVDAHAREKLLLGGEIERGEDELGAGAGAGADVASEDERAAEKSGGATDASGADVGADGGAGDDFAATNHGWNQADMEAVLAAEAGKQGDVAQLAMAKAEVFADKNGAHGELVEEDADEVFGGVAGEFEVEAKDEDSVEASLIETFETLGKRANLRRGLGGAKDFQRQRVESNGGGDGGGGASVFEDAAQDFLVADVNTVEIADGQRSGAASGPVARTPFTGRVEDGARHQVHTSKVRPS